MALQTFQEANEYNEPFTLFLSGGHEYHGFYTDIRIDRKTVPEGWHVYDLREGNGEEWFSELKNGYNMVNHMGTFATKEDIGLPEGESLYYCEEDIDEGYRLKDDEFDYSFN